MNCPKCQSPLHQITYEGVEVDFCSGCKGMWFDADEMAFTAELGADLPELAAVQRDAHTTAYACPRCADSRLQEMKFVQAEALLLDRCPQCHGLWLDRGEFLKVQKIAAHLGDARSKLLLTCKQLKAKGYDVLGARSPEKS